MGENAHLDANSRPTITFLANDGSGLIYNGQINPITGALICEADVLSSNTSIGGTIPGGTAGSVLFLDIGGTLAQDNANFYYNPTSHFLALGHNSPAATLDVHGSVRFNLGGDATGDMYYRNSAGFLEALPIGTGGQVLSVSAGLPTWVNNAAVSGYDTIETNGTPVTQRSTMNFSSLFTVTDSSSPARTNIDINVTALAADPTLLSTLNLGDISGQIDLSTQVTGQLNASNIDIASLEAVLDLGNLQGQIDLATQVTGQLDAANIDQASLDLSMIGGDLDLSTQVGSSILQLANGGTATALSNPGANTLFGWDDTDNSAAFFNIGSGLSYDHATHTISATGATNPINPSSQTYIFDDFIGGGVATTTIGECGWLATPNPVISVTGGANHPGVIQFDTNNSQVQAVYLERYIGVIEAEATYEWMVKLGNASNPAMVAITNNVYGSASGTDVCLAFKASGGGNWDAVYGDGVSPTTIGSVATSTNFVKLTIVVNSGGIAEFFVDGVSLGTTAVAANGADMRVVFSNINTSPVKTYQFDYFYMNKVIAR